MLLLLATAHYEVSEHKVNLHMYNFCRDFISRNCEKTGSVNFLQLRSLPLSQISYR